MKPAPELVALIERTVRSRNGRAKGREIRFQCPAHDDRHPSARWSRDQQVWHCDVCKAGGGAKDLATRLGLELPAAPIGSVRRETVYSIRDAHGLHIAEHVRIEGVGGRKTFTWRRDGRPGLRGLPAADLPLYGAECVAGLDRSRPVFLVEGEKAADRLRDLGVQALGTVTGAGGVPRAGSLEVLRGLEVVLWPDNDEPGAEHMARIAELLAGVVGSFRVLAPAGLPQGGDAVDWFERRAAEGKTNQLIVEELERTAREVSEGSNLAAGVAAAPGQGSRWSLALDAPSFLAASEEEVEFLEERLLAPGALTLWFSPRGLGKTHAAHAIALKLSRAGRRVLLIDRDNSAREVRRRLRGWGGEEARSLEVMTRDQSPPLTEAAAWRDFPAAKYDLVILDSLDSAAEGVGERDSEKPSRALAVLLDIARQQNGPAILVLGNTVKTAAHSRGSGVIEDRADIVFEVRDATELRPTGSKPWIEELPPAEAGAWAQRTTRRQQRSRYRLAFAPTKFRIGEEPEPFILEVDLSTAPWTLRDVTDLVDRAGADSRREREYEAQKRRDSGLVALARTVAERASAGTPLIKSDAERLLCGNGFTRQAARAAIAEESAWRLEAQADQRGKPVALLPRNPPGRGGGENVGPSAKPYLPGISASPSSAAEAGQAWQESTALKPLPAKDLPDAHLPADGEAVTPRADRQAAPGNAGAATVEWEAIDL